MTDEYPISGWEAGRTMALVRAWAEGDHDRFRSVALQFAAGCARTGAPGTAQKIRDMVDHAHEYATYLPPFSLAVTKCNKCNSGMGAPAKYVREGSVEFLERSCAACGYTWYERCADYGGAQ